MFNSISLSKKHHAQILILSLCLFKNIFIRNNPWIMDLHIHDLVIEYLNYTVAWRNDSLSLHNVVFVIMNKNDRNVGVT